MARIAESFDFDLLKLVPRAAEILQPVADIRLEVPGDASPEGLLVCPSVWNADSGGFMALYGFQGSTRHQIAPPHYWTEKPLVRTNALEAICDAWYRNYKMYINLVLVWDARRCAGIMHSLMYDARGHHRLSEQVRRELQNRAIKSLRKAALQIETMAEHRHLIARIRHTKRARSGLSSNREL